MGSASLAWRILELVSILVSLGGGVKSCGCGIANGGNKPVIKTIELQDDYYFDPKTLYPTIDYNMESVKSMLCNVLKNYNSKESVSTSKSNTQTTTFDSMTGTKTDPLLTTVIVKRNPTQTTVSTIISTSISSVLDTTFIGAVSSVRTIPYITVTEHHWSTTATAESSFSTQYPSISYILAPVITADNKVCTLKPHHYNPETVFLGPPIQTNAHHLISNGSNFPLYMINASVVYLQGPMMSPISIKPSTTTKTCIKTTSTPSIIITTIFPVKNNHYICTDYTETFIPADPCSILSSSSSNDTSSVVLNSHFVIYLVHSVAALLLINLVF